MAKSHLSSLLFIYNSFVIHRKKLEERAKEVKEFYKSESESDNDGDDPEYKPTNDELTEDHCANKDNEENTKEEEKQDVGSASSEKIVENQENSNSESAAIEDFNNSNKNVDAHGIDIQDIQEKFIDTLSETNKNTSLIEKTGMETENVGVNNELTDQKNGITEVDSGIFSEEVLELGTNKLSDTNSPMETNNVQVENNKTEGK